MNDKLSKTLLALLLLFSIFSGVVSPAINTCGEEINHCNDHFSTYAEGAPSLAVTKNSTSNPKDLRYFNLSHHAKTMFPSTIQDIYAITTATGSAGLRVYNGRVKAFGAESWTFTVKNSAGGYEQIRTVTVDDINNDGADEVIIFSETGILYALSATGTLLWRTSTGLTDYTAITVQNATQTSGSEILLYDDGENTFWIYSSMGYAIDRVSVNGNGIHTITTGQINDTMKGRELVLLNHSNAEPDLTVINNWNLNTKEVFSIDLSWFPNNLNIHPKLLVEDLATEEGREIAVAVKENGNRHLEMGVYTSAGGTTRRWDGPQTYNPSGGNLLQFTAVQLDDTTHLVLTAPTTAVIAENETSVIQITDLNLIDSAIIDAPATPQPDLATVYRNGTTDQIESNCLNITTSTDNVLWQRNISVGTPTTYVAETADSIYIASEEGLYAVLSKEGQVTDSGTILVGANTQQNRISDSYFYEFFSSQKIRVLDKDRTNIARVSPSERGATILTYNIGDYYPSETGLETAAVERTFTDRQLTFFDQSGDTLASFLLNPNYTVEALGAPYPDARKLPIGMQNITNNTYYATVLDLNAPNLTFGHELYGRPQQIMHATFRNQNTYIYYTTSDTMLHVMDSNAEFIGFKTLPATLEQLEAKNLDKKGGDELIYTYGDTLTILQDDFSETTINPGLSFGNFLVANLITHFDGNEIVATAGDYLFLLNQTGVLSYSDVGFTGQIATFVEPVNASGDITFLVASNTDCAIMRMWVKETSIKFTVDETIAIPGLSATPLIHSQKNRSAIGTFTFTNATGSWMGTLTVQKDYYHPTISTDSPSLKRLNATNITLTWKNNITLFTKIRDDASLKQFEYRVQYYNKEGNQIKSDSATYSFKKKPTFNHTLAITLTNNVAKLTITLQTSDWVGRTGEERMLIHVDREAPSLQLQTPSLVRTSGKDVSVATLVRDNIQLKTVYLTIQENTLPMTPQPASPVLNRTKTYRYTAEIPFDLLTEGTNTVTIVAVDQAGHSREIAITIMTPESPQILGLSPTTWGVIGVIAAAIVAGIGGYRYWKRYRKQET